MDEHWLTVIACPLQEGPARLLIIDTSERGSTRETSFCFPDPGDSDWRLSSEPCGHISSLDELNASPFYPDSSQRIVALSPSHINTRYVIKTELLLELARRWTNRDIEWDEWRTHMIEVAVGDHERMWITGCRLFFITPGDAQSPGKAYLQMYDFSHRGRAKSLNTPAAGENGGVRRMSQCSAKRELPWDALDICCSTVGHDSIAFCVVSIDSSIFCSQLNCRFYVRHCLV